MIYYFKKMLNISNKLFYLHKEYDIVSIVKYA